jgi:SAM-dependent methyltransferase
LGRDADHFDRAIAAYDDRFLAAADVQDADRVLDVGCGTGKNTRDAARAAASGSALGADLSSRMIELARRHAMLGDLDDAGRKRALDALRSTTAAHETDRGVVYDSAAWLITARRP